MRNRAEEDYIKAIYELTVERNQDLIKTNELAERFGFTDQSVNEMIKKLATKHLIEFYPYRGVELTSIGKKLATKMIRAHRLWEVFLNKKLGFSWEDVHPDAEILEHASSDDLLLRLESFLGNPKYCQHGNPIPDQNGISEPAFYQTMLDVPVGESFEIKRVLDAKELLIYLNERQIKLYDKYKIIDKDDFNRLLTIKSDLIKHIISYHTAKMIFIEHLK